MGQRVEEIADLPRREKHLYREWPWVPGQPSRKSEVVDDALDQQHVHFQSVAMLIPVQHRSVSVLRIPHQVFDLPVGWQRVVESLPRWYQLVASAQAGAKEFWIPSSLVKRPGGQGLDDGINSGGRLDPLDPRFAAFSSFHHRLHCFQGVNVITVDSANGHAQGFLDPGPQRHVDLGNTSRHRQARTGQ